MINIIGNTVEMLVVWVGFVIMIVIASMFLVAGIRIMKELLKEI